MPECDAVPRVPQVIVALRRRRLRRCCCYWGEVTGWGSRVFLTLRWRSGGHERDTMLIWDECVGGELSWRDNKREREREPSPKAIA